jgi:phosphoribosylanthranilate isomerase
MLLKVCGITRLTDALHAVNQGATALGFVFWPKSPRYVTAEQAAAIIAELPPTLMTIGVFVNEPVDGIKATVQRAGLTTVQLHGDEPPAYADALPWPLLRSLALADVPLTAWPPETTVLLDAADPLTRGGTGRTIDWDAAAEVARQRKVILAGGLTPENVATAIATVRPFGVDVSSGVEEAPGVKDFDKVTRFLANARTAFERCQGEG